MTQQPAPLLLQAVNVMPQLLCKGVVTVEDIVELPSECSQLAAETLIASSLSSQNVLPFHKVATKLHNDILLNKCITFVRASFVGLRKLLGDETLRGVLGQDIFDSLLREHEQSLAERARLVKGRVTTGTWPENAVVPNPDGTIPYELLSLRLNEWPPFINPMQRERYLSDLEFERVLQMTPFQFYQLPTWKQQRLKAAVYLF